MNFYNAIDNPNLIDFCTKHFISNNLKMCHNNRVSYYTYIFNFGILFLFISVVFVILYNLSNYKQSTAEVQEKMMNDQDYILSKIKHYKDTNKNNQSMITELPTIPNNVPIHNLPHL
jgi:3-methyladenine DNA glycosylase AlkD